jgi:hypothetical protein
MEICAIFIYILAVSKFLTANYLKYLCGSVRQCLLYIVGLKIASDLAFMPFSNGGTLGIGLFVVIGGTLQLELALKLISVIRINLFSKGVGTAQSV